MGNMSKIISGMEDVGQMLCLCLNMKKQSEVMAWPQECGEDKSDCKCVRWLPSIF